MLFTSHITEKGIAPYAPFYFFRGVRSRQSLIPKKCLFLKKTIGNLILGRILVPERSRLLQDRRAPLMVYRRDRIFPPLSTFQIIPLSTSIWFHTFVGHGGLLTALPPLRTALPLPSYSYDCRFQSGCFLGSATGLIIEAKAVARRGAAFLKAGPTGGQLCRARKMRRPTRTFSGKKQQLRDVFRHQLKVGAFFCRFSNKTK